MAKLHFGSKEYFEKQSEFWFKENSKHISERDAYKKQRDELINDKEEAKKKAKCILSQHDRLQLRKLYRLQDRLG